MNSFKARGVVAILIALLPFGIYAQTGAPSDGKVNKITFNTWQNNPRMGDEHRFYTVSEYRPNAKPTFYMTTPEQRLAVKDGDELVLRIVVHNNADTKSMHEHGQTVTAKDVNVAVSLPDAAATKVSSKATIAASNADPKRISDIVYLSGARPLTLSYVPNSALYYWYPSGSKRHQKQLNQDLVNGGVSLGDVTPGSQEGYILFRVKVNMQDRNLTGGTKAPSGSHQQSQQTGGTKAPGNTGGHAKANTTQSGTSIPATPSVITGPGHGQMQTVVTPPTTVNVQQTQSQNQSQNQESAKAVEDAPVSPPATQQQTQANAQAEPTATANGQADVDQVQAESESQTQAQDELPDTGGAAGLAGLTGGGAMGAAALAYRRSRQSFSRAVKRQR